MTKRSIHLICNAHLDPVWLWQWQEGAAEALSTFRTAAELCEKDNAYIFNHNEVILYKWIQEYEPELFKRIQKLVKILPMLCQNQFNHAEQNSTVTMLALH